MKTQEQKVQYGPTLYLIDQDPAYKAATCVGCKNARIVESHFVYCKVQEVDGSVRVWPSPTLGLQIQLGQPNRGCPYINQVDTFKAGKRVPRDLSALIQAMAYHKGWEELCPDEGKWYFRKKNWLATVHWEARTVRFSNCRRKKEAA